MNNWIKLIDEEREKIWDYIYPFLNFHPHGSKGEVVKLSGPNIRLDIQNYFNEQFSETAYNDLHSKFLSVFKLITGPENFIYAFDWHHDCFKVYLDRPIDLNEFDEWLISPFPNGDIIFFFTEDYKNVYVGDGVNMDIYLYGTDLIEGFKNNKPEIFIHW